MKYIKCKCGTTNALENRRCWICDEPIGTTYGALGPGGSVPPKLKPWNCPMCGFVNTGRTDRCNMCLAPPPGSDLPDIQTTKTDGTDAILTERAKTHGDFRVHAGIAQDLKEIMHASLNWKILTDSQRESLEMNAHKIGRILAGNPDEPDHWDDIAGYARLVGNQLRKG